MLRSYAMFTNYFTRRPERGGEGGQMAWAARSERPDEDPVSSLVLKETRGKCGVHKPSHLVRILKYCILGGQIRRRGGISGYPG